MVSVAKVEGLSQTIFIASRQLYLKASTFKVNHVRNITNNTEEEFDADDSASQTF